MFLYVIGDFFEPHLAVNHLLAQLLIPSLISAFERQLESRHPRSSCCNEKGPCAGIHAADVSLQQILRIDRLPPDLGIEIETAGGEAAGLYDFQNASDEFRHVHRELVGIPAEQIVAAIDVDRSEDAQRRSERDLVLESVSGEDGVILLDIDLDVLLQTVCFQQPVNRRDVIVILVLGRLLRLRFDIDAAP